MANDQVEKERLRLEFEFKKWEKSQEMAHQVKLAEIQAAGEVEKAKIEEEAKSKALEKEAELRVNEVLETHDKVVGTLQLQVEKNNAEAEKYKALLDLQEQRKSESKSELADVLKILEQLKNDG